MSKAGRQLIEAAQEAVAIAKGEQPAARITIAGHAYVPENRWQPPDECPVNGVALVLMGETIPGVADIRVGTRITGESAEEIGYREFAKYGGWLIWNDGSDFYVEDIDRPVGWMPVPAIPAD